MSGVLRHLLLGAAFTLAFPYMAHAAGAAAGHATQVDIRNFGFSPKSITIPVGTRVVWTNHDEEPHVVTSAGAGFVSSKALDTSDTYAVTFSKPGTYAYYCSIHPMMVGTIVVQ